MKNLSSQPFAEIPNHQEVVCMDLFESGRIGLLIQDMYPCDEIMRAFHSGPEEYGYLEIGEVVPVALWSFRFRYPLGLIEVSFDLQRASSEQITTLLSHIDEPSIRFYLRQEGQLVNISDLDMSAFAWASIQGTLCRQREANYTKHEFNCALENIYLYSAEEIMTMSQRFNLSHKQNRQQLRFIASSHSFH